MKGARSAPACCSLSSGASGTVPLAMAVAQRVTDVEKDDSTAAADRGPERYLNRELSWLDFNDRVLALAEDRSVPLLERAKFLAIFSQNLDEFFMVRVAGLNDQLAAGLGATVPDGMSPGEQLAAIRERAGALVERQSRVFVDEIAPGLAESAVGFSSWGDLGEDDRQHPVQVFDEQIFPVLTPLAVDPGHPFPYISNLSLNLAVMGHDPARDERRFAPGEVPPPL